MGNTANKQQEKRVQRCMISFQQLQADIRHINVHCSLEFARVPPTAAGSDGDASSEPLVLQFRPFTKLSKKSSLPWLWKVNDNVIVTATVTTKREAEATLAAAASPGATTATAAAPASAAAASAASSSGGLLPSVSRCYTLTLHQFYELFISYVDNVKLVQTLRDQVLKIEQPAVWEAKQEARRMEVLQQRAKKHSVGGHEENLTLTASAAVAAGAAAPDEQKDEHKAAAASAASSLAPSSLSRNSSTDSAGLTCASKATSGECCICLTAPDEEALGEELVVLSCLHAFCSECIAEWRAHSPTCPLCRRDLEDAEEDSGDSWILTSPNLADLKSSLARLLDFPFDFVSSKPAFPPRDNSKGVKSAGDAFSLVVGEAIDVFETATRKHAKPTLQQQPAQAKSNQPADTTQTAGATSPAAPKTNTTTTTTTAQSNTAHAPSTPLP